MSYLRIVTTAALSSASLIALATPAAAVTSNLPRIQGYQDAVSVCRINYSYRVTGTENDTAVQDVYQEQLVDLAQNTLAQRPLRSVQNGLSSSVTTQIDIAASSIPAASAARGAPIVAIYDTDAAGVRQQIQGNVFVDLAQMSSAGGQCAQVAQTFGFGANGTPVTDAGPDQTVPAGSTVTLDGTGSSDPDGDALTYQWTQVSGPPTTLTNANQAQATAQTQAGAPASYIFELTTTDPSGAASTDRVSVQTTGMSGPPTNRVPVADAGGDMTVASGATGVRLDATGSSDPDGDALTYRWTQTAGTTVAINGAASANATFDAPATAQTLTFEVTVTDPQGLSSTDSVSFTVSANQAPVADAGMDAAISPPDPSVPLDAAGSSDPDGDTLTYQWTQLSGPNATLTNASSASATFASPAQTGSVQTLVFQVEVTDPSGLTDTDTVTFTLPANTTPVADAGANIGPINSGQTVTLDGSGSSDADGDALTYSWRQTGGPSVQLSNASSASPSFTAPNVNGSRPLFFELTVSDGTATSAGDTVRVDVQGLGSVTIVQRVTGADTAVSYSSNIASLAGSVQTSGGVGTITSGDIASGNYSFSVTDQRTAGYALTALSCSDDDSSVSLADGTVAIALSPSEDLTCTVTLSDTRSAAQQAIGEFVGGRSAVLLANEPSLARRLGRLKGNAAGGGNAVVGNVAVPGSGKLPVDVNVSSNSRSVSSSLGMARASLGQGGENGGLDIWVEAKVADVTLGRNQGTFTIGYAGVDYLVGNSLLVGALVQYDRFDNDIAGLSTGQSEGEGWMAGPYVTARISKHLYLDGRVAIGGSSNTVSPLGTYIDSFDTDRLLGSAAIIGDLPLGGGFTFWPEVEIRYLRENVDGYTDSLGVIVPDAEIDQGEVAFSPRLQYHGETAGGWTLSPFVQAEGIATFGSDAFSPVDNGLRARLAIGFDAMTTGTLRIGLSGFFDGIGQDDYEANGISVNLGFSF